jgi:RHS repeat-associated protein
MNANISLQGTENGTAAPGWANNPSTCLWTATNSAGASVQYTEIMTTKPPLPTITVARTPNPMTANQPYTLTWSTTNAVAVSRACTSTVTGFASNGAMNLQGPENGTAAAGWANYPSTCVWTATNSVGATAQFTETMMTRPPLPTISVSRTPSPMTANAAYTLNWATTNAASLSRTCTSTGSGFISSGAMGLQGPQSGTAAANWAGFPSTCVWTATNSAGVTAQFTETMTTTPAVPVAGLVYIHTDGLGSPVARSDSTGAVISVTRYEPYGLTAGGAAPTIGFTGHVNDAETGLTYMQQRYYDPVAGRFLSIDPVTTDANTGSSFNRYAYANNSPYKYVDPNGRNPLGIFLAFAQPMAIGAAIGGTVDAAMQCNTQRRVKLTGERTAF